MASTPTTPTKPSPADKAPKPRASSRRRDEILAVAASVFARKGIAGATVRDIADEAGILSGSLYHHFESKDQMVVELLVPQLVEHRDRYVELAASSPDPMVVLERFIEFGVRGVAANPDTARVLHNEAVLFQTVEAFAPLDQRRQEVRRLWVSVVKKGVKAGVFRSGVDPDVAVRAIFDTVYSSARWLPPRGKSTPERVGAQLSRMFLLGLRAG